MKVGILTFHDGINHGGFLQAFAMQKHLSSLGINTKIIHYRNKRHFFTEYRGLFLQYRPWNIFRNFKKFLAFKRSQRRMTQTRFTMSSKTVHRMGFDVIIFGSDIIWNFEWEELGRDRIYFGKGLDNSRLVAYAPSFGAAADSESIPNDILALLKRFHALSVRDSVSMSLLKKHDLDNVSLTVDPTFLVDWEEELKPCAIPEKFLLVYAYQLQPAEIQEVKKYAKSNRLTTLAIGYPQPWCDYNYSSTDPFEFLYCFKKAEAVITSTFHGTIFSLIFLKSFYTSSNSSIKSKTQEFLVSLDLKERLSAEPENLLKILSEYPDYVSITHQLTKKIAASKEYLNRSLGIK